MNKPPSLTIVSSLPYFSNKERLRSINRAYRIPARTGSTAITNLRPGDWLGNVDYPDVRWCVLINSEAMGRIVLFSAVLGYESSYDYSTIATGAIHMIGTGRWRWWHRFLPKYLRDITCPYSQP